MYMYMYMYMYMQLTLYLSGKVLCSHVCSLIRECVYILSTCIYLCIHTYMHTYSCKRYTPVNSNAFT